MKEKLLKKTDIYIAAAILIIGIIALFILRSGEGIIAIVEYNGKEVKTIDLAKVDEEYTFIVEGDIEVEITVAPGKIGFTKSSCPDKLCIRFGMLDKRGDIASCVPARVSIRITGSDKNSPDGITG